jgi:fluoroacetyl-CoA thioesterase
VEKDTLRVGLSTSIESKVSQENTAEEMGSGSLAVYATPSMAALMEKAALTAVEQHLPAGSSTVGTSLSIRHMAATPVGMRVRAVAELVEIQDRKLTFKIEAFDEAEKIGEGMHERYIIDVDRFTSKVQAKRKQ